jgi:hypothetical protein
MQEVEDAMVDAVMDSASGLGLTPLQRAKFIVAISETLIDAVAPYVSKPEAATPAAPKRVRGKNKPKPLPPGAAAVAAAVAAAPIADLQPAPFKGPPATVQPFAG